MRARTPSRLDFQLDQTFFGFNPEHQLIFHQQLFDLLWAGDGRWDWDTIYNLPLHIKRLWIKRVNEQRNPNSTPEQEQKQAEELKEKFAMLPKIAM